MAYREPQPHILLSLLDTIGASISRQHRTHHFATWLVRARLTPTTLPKINPGPILYPHQRKSSQYSRKSTHNSHQQHQRPLYRIFFSTNSDKTAPFKSYKMADRGRGGGFGSRGGDRGRGGRGRGRGRRGGKSEEKEWMPVTKLGRLVKAGKINSMEEIYLHSLPIKEFQIVDNFLPKLKDEVMKVRTTMISRESLSQTPRTEQRQREPCLRAQLRNELGE